MAKCTVCRLLPWFSRNIKIHFLALTHHLHKMYFSCIKCDCSAKELINADPVWARKLISTLPSATFWHTGAHDDRIQEDEKGEVGEGEVGRENSSCKLVQAFQEAMQFWRCCWFIRYTSKAKQVWYFISKNQPGFRHSDPLKSSPGGPSLLVSDSVGITSSCSLLVFPLSVSLTSSCLCSQYPSRTRNCARLLIVATQSSRLWTKLSKVRSHGNNVRDVIIVHVISADAHTYIDTNRCRKGKVI